MATDCPCEAAIWAAVGATPGGGGCVRAWDQGKRNTKVNHVYCSPNSSCTGSVRCHDAAESQYLGWGFRRGLHYLRTPGTNTQRMNTKWSRFGLVSVRIIIPMLLWNWDFTSFVRLLYQYVNYILIFLKTLCNAGIGSANTIVIVNVCRTLQIIFPIIYFCLTSVHVCIW